jgi:hypothetical protein
LFLGQTNSRSPFLEFSVILLGGTNATLATPGCRHSIYLSQMVIKRVPQHSRTFQKFVFGADQFQKPVSGISWNFVGGQKCHFGNTRVPIFCLFVTDGHKKCSATFVNIREICFWGRQIPEARFWNFLEICWGAKVPHWQHQGADILFICHRWS